MEQQRDIYKRNMEELLDKIDPGTKKNSEIFHFCVSKISLWLDRRQVADQEKYSDKENESLVPFTRKPKVILKSNLPPAPVQVLKGLQNTLPSHHIVKEHHYSPSAYQVTSKLLYVFR